MKNEQRCIGTASDEWLEYLQCIVIRRYNELPDLAVQQSNAARKPDIGEEVEDTSNIWTWFENLFTEDTYVCSIAID